MIKKIEQRLLQVEMTEDQRTAVKRIVEETIGEVVESLEDTVKRWEELNLEDDKSLYTLGIRRSVDVVTGESFLSQLPVLEAEDTPNE